MSRKMGASRCFGWPGGARCAGCSSGWLGLAVAVGSVVVAPQLGERQSQPTWDGNLG